jgi:hypothetical protein
MAHVVAYAAPFAGYVRSMTHGHDPDRIDPSKQSGRPVMVTGAVVGIILAVLLMLVVYLLAR